MASTLTTIDKRIARLQEIRAMIVEEFGQQPVNGSSRPQRKPRPNIATQIGGRKTQIHDWLKQNGPATRSEIIKGTSLPHGTVGGYLSSEKELFESRDGKWQAR